MFQNELAPEQAVVDVFGHVFPFQCAVVEVQEHVEQRFQVVATALQVALVVVDAGIPHCADERQTRLHRMVLALLVDELRRQPEVEDVQSVLGGRCAPDGEVVRLDVAVDDTQLVQVAEEFEGVTSEPAHGLGCPLLLGGVEHHVETLAELLHHDGLLPLLTNVHRTAPQQSRYVQRFDVAFFDVLPQVFVYFDLALQQERVVVQFDGDRFGGVGHVLRTEKDLAVASRTEQTGFGVVVDSEDAVVEDYHSLLVRLDVHRITVSQ